MLAAAAKCLVVSNSAVPWTIYSPPVSSILSFLHKLYLRVIKNKLNFLYIEVFQLIDEEIRGLMV